MYEEVNKYREKNGVQPLQPIERLMNYSLQWGDYLMRNFVDYESKDSVNILFHHSDLGPKEYHLPSQVGENIGITVYNSKPTMEEVVREQMYGKFRGTESKGYTNSYWHNYNLLYPNAKYVGCAVYFFYTEKNNQWVAFSVQNFDCVLER
jgi:uncharacterized protein YkwD